MKNGLGALERTDRSFLAGLTPNTFADSLNLDEALRADFPESPRWDYVLGHSETRRLFGLEAHSARGDEISTVIDKRRAAAAQLSSHLKPGHRISAWFWVASGKVGFADTEKARRRLDEAGIQFVGRQLLVKHLSS